MRLKSEIEKDSKMAVTKAKKIEQVEKLTRRVQSASHAIVGTFAKLTVEKDFELRKAVRGAGGTVSRGEEHAGRARGEGHARSKRR